MRTPFRLWAGWPQRPGLSQGHRSQDDSLRAQLKDAHQRWQLAQQQFHSVHDPILVDLAIAELEAAQLTYEELLREARLHHGK